MRGLSLRCFPILPMVGGGYLVPSNGREDVSCGMPLGINMLIEVGQIALAQSVAEVQTIFASMPGAFSSAAGQRDS